MLIAALLFSLVACGTAPDTGDMASEKTATQALTSDTEMTPNPTKTHTSSPNTEAGSESKTLIAFFSRADENYNVGYIEKGNTHIIAEMIAEETGGTLFHIERDTPYPADYNACTDEAKAEQNGKARPALKEDIDIAGYDVIYLGYPIWWGDMPMVVYTFLEGHDFAGKTILPFCTHEGSGVSGTDQNITEVCPDATVLKALSIHGSVAQNEREEARSSVLAWLDESGHEASGTKLAIQIGDTILTATLADNSSAEALKKLLASHPLTISMSDYGDFEKVGELGSTLPRNDETIATEAGDLILYQGSRFVIYYDTNIWDFTRLGKIDSVSAGELREILGEGDVTATLSLINA